MPDKVLTKKDNLTTNEKCLETRHDFYFNLYSVSRQKIEKMLSGKYSMQNNKKSVFKLANDILFCNFFDKKKNEKKIAGHMLKYNKRKYVKLKS